MIVTHQSDKPVEFDAASITTLVDEKGVRIPRHLAKFVSASLPIALVAFICAIVDNVIRSQDPKKLAPIILAFVLTLPHHGETLLLVWLQRHHTDSILPFTPCSPHAIAYAVGLGILWTASAVECAVSLHHTQKHAIIRCRTTTASDGTMGKDCASWEPDVLWPSIISTLTSSIELALILSITLICYLHNRRVHKSSSSPSLPSSSMSESKIPQA